MSEISRVLPPSEYPIQDMPLDHPLLKTQFEIKEFPQIPSIQSWRGNPATRRPSAATTAPSRTPAPSPISTAT